MIEAEERGYRWIGERFVCEECIDDPDLKAFVKESGSANLCSYCKADSVAAPADDLLAEIADALRLEFTALVGP